MLLIVIIICMHFCTNNPCQMMWTRWTLALWLGKLAIELLTIERLRDVTRQFFVLSPPLTHIFYSFFLLAELFAPYILPFFLSRSIAILFLSISFFIYSWFIQWSFVDDKKKVIKTLSINRTHWMCVTHLEILKATVLLKQEKKQSPGVSYHKYLLVFWQQFVERLNREQQ